MKLKIFWRNKNAIKEKKIHLDIYILIMCFFVYFHMD